MPCAHTVPARSRQDRAFEGVSPPSRTRRRYSSLRPTITFGQDSPTHSRRQVSPARWRAPLRLNEDLVEAIALGHDLGHAPFGHIGEAALDDILQERGGGEFRHNVHSLQSCRASSRTMAIGPELDRRGARRRSQPHGADGAGHARGGRSCALSTALPISITTSMTPIRAGVLLHEHGSRAPRLRCSAR